MGSVVHNSIDFWAVFRVTGFAYVVVGYSDSVIWDGRKKANKMALVGGGGSDAVLILYGTIIHILSLFMFLYKGPGNVIRGDVVGILFFSKRKLIGTSA
jgi:hypothetical protein